MRDKAQKDKHRPETLTTAMNVGKRISEAFGYRQIQDIVICLNCEREDIVEVINGKMLPSATMLIAINAVTGASIDWLLTGNGLKYGRADRSVDNALEPVSPAMWFAGEERERTGQLL